MKETLLFVICLDERDLLVAAAGETQVTQRLRVDGEDAAGCAVFGRHVADGGTIGERELGNSRPKELDKLADDAEFAQRLGHGEDQVGCRCALA